LFVDLTPLVPLSLYGEGENIKRGAKPLLNFLNLQAIKGVIEVVPKWGSKGAKHFSIT
jgi:hypothetical protein